MATVTYSGNWNGRVNQSLLSILTQAAAQWPGTTVEFISGRDSRPYTGNHPAGRAIDVRLYDAAGQPIYNEPVSKATIGTAKAAQTAAAYRSYQSFANIARGIQQKQYPGLADKFAWGGNFGFDRKGRNAADLMHFDVGGNRGSWGNWESGLTAAGLKNLPGAASVGMADPEGRLAAAAAKKAGLLTGDPIDTGITGLTAATPELETAPPNEAPYASAYNYPGVPHAGVTFPDQNVAPPPNGIGSPAIPNPPPRPDSVPGIYDPAAEAMGALTGQPYSPYSLDVTATAGGSQGAYADGGTIPLLPPSPPPRPDRVPGVYDPAGEAMGGLTGQPYSPPPPPVAYNLPDPLADRGASWERDVDNAHARQTAIQDPPSRRATAYGPGVANLYEGQFPSGLGMAPQQPSRFDYAAAPAGSLPTDVPSMGFGQPSDSGLAMPTPDFSPGAQPQPFDYAGAGMTTGENFTNDRYASAGMPAPDFYPGAQSQPLPTITASQFDQRFSNPFDYAKAGMTTGENFTNDQYPTAPQVAFDHGRFDDAFAPASPAPDDQAQLAPWVPGISIQTTSPTPMAEQGRLYSNASPTSEDLYGAPSPWSALAAATDTRAQEVGAVPATIVPDTQAASNYPTGNSPISPETGIDHYNTDTYNTPSALAEPWTPATITPVQTATQLAPDPVQASPYTPAPQAPAGFGQPSAYDPLSSISAPLAPPAPAPSLDSIPGISIGSPVTEQGVAPITTPGPAVAPPPQAAAPAEPTAVPAPHPTIMAAPPPQPQQMAPPPTPPQPAPAPKEHPQSFLNSLWNTVFGQNSGGLSSGTSYNPSSSPYGMGAGSAQSIYAFNGTAYSPYMGYTQGSYNPSQAFH